MNALIFGGTTEGRLLAGALKKNGVSVTLIVATNYGKGLAQAFDAVYAKRLTREEMAEHIKNGNFKRVVDATHPYAAEASKNIAGACADTGAEYIRLVRGESGVISGCTYVESAKEAAMLLNETEGAALIAAGSKALPDFTKVNNYKERLFVRVIPLEESLRGAVSLGYKSSNIICMQGPFTTDINIAMLQMINASYLVTKDSGDEGGFYEKVSAAKIAGCNIIVIKRPKESGFTFEQVLKLFNIDSEDKHAVFAPKDDADHKCANDDAFSFFPLFVDMRGKKVVIAGGGRIASRRAVRLADIGAVVTVISPAAEKDILDYSNSGKINYIARNYEEGDICGAFLAIAATNDSEVNRAVLKDADKNGVLIITADSRKSCECYFPAIAENDKYMAGIVSKNGDHIGLAHFAKNMRRFF